VLYEATEQGLDKPLGRQYDIWSIGVIILEHIIWLLHGPEGVPRFKKDVMGISANPKPCYEVGYLNGQKIALLRKVVSGWMDHITKDPSCANETAMGDLLALVTAKLLVVALPFSKVTPARIGGLSAIVEPSTRHLETDDLSVPTFEKRVATLKNARATSQDLVRGLQMIHEESDVEGYWFKAAPPGYPRQYPPEAAIKERLVVEDSKLTYGWDITSGSGQTALDRGLF
jgi:hypothetical protein